MTNCVCGWDRAGMSPDGPTPGFIAIFSTGLSVLMFSSQQTPHSQRAPACPPTVPARQNKYFPPAATSRLTKDFPPETSQRFSQPGAKPARLLGQQCPRNIRSYWGAAPFVSEVRLARNVDGDVYFMREKITDNWGFKPINLRHLHARMQADIQFQNTRGL